VAMSFSVPPMARTFSGFRLLSSNRHGNSSGAN